MTIPIDYGVLVYMDRPATDAFFDRLEIPYIPLTIPTGGSTSYVDFNTGDLVGNYTGPAADVATATALGTYLGLCASYAPLTSPNYAQLGKDEVPEDLAMPFGEFVTKYGLQAMIPTLYSVYPGFLDIVNVSTLFVMASFGIPQITALQATQLGTAGGFITPASHDNQQIYDAALLQLGSSVLLNSTVSSATRSKSGVKLAVKTPEGTKILRAKKLLVTIPPTKQNLGWLDLDQTETSLFSKWIYENQYIAVLSNTGLPNGTSVTDVSLSADTFNLPSGFFVNAFTATGVADLYTTRVYGGVSEADGHDLINHALTTMAAAGTFPSAQTPTYAAFASHPNSLLHVSPQDLSAGFFQDLFALQGQLDTFWTGAAWTTDYSSLIWEFTDTVLPELVASLS